MHIPEELSIYFSDIQSISIVPQCKRVVIETQTHVIRLQQFNGDKPFVTIHITTAKGDDVYNTHFYCKDSCLWPVNQRSGNVFNLTPYKIKLQRGPFVLPIKSDVVTPPHYVKERKKIEVASFPYRRVLLEQRKLDLGNPPIDSFPPGSFLIVMQELLNNLTMRFPQYIFISPDGDIVDQSYIITREFITLEET